MPFDIKYPRENGPAVERAKNNTAILAYHAEMVFTLFILVRNRMVKTSAPMVWRVEKRIE
jgi:hypothetical protein